MDALYEVTKHAQSLGVRYITAYVFSTENWKRTEEEVGYLMGLVPKAMRRFLDEFMELDARLVILGSRDGVDHRVMKEFDNAVEKTKNNKGATLALCFNYGGRQEIVSAARGIFGASCRIEEVTEENFVDHLYGGKDIPDIDLVIRTSGEKRLSGFMLWHAAYAELYFVDKYWPDFGPKDLDEAIAEYARRNRRFGK